ncbi:hypothetical protein Vretimale_190 [Volvox reticuliferus]|uniref:Lebercilin domain-containing protein n=1 Tax=Volvox reticuliferus TaxID=1737510 RepID=A0A8J4FWZ0_9CHLO|nr:hypothetical protein Vretifemale_8351 [Volvox reticuliferus]GIL93812.1 hypothetical protein Vretimale_190 [Volvox reticuliferus]
MESSPYSALLDSPSVATDFQSMLPVESRSTNQSPLRPGSTLVAYQPNGANAPRTPGRMGKSQHMAQIRSLGLLHDLQEYISSVECLAAEQKRELEKVREEKRDMERCLARAEVAAQERGPGPVLDFSVSEVADLPPRLRALVEDNRGLRELVKRYKFRNASLEHQLVQSQAQILALADANERLKQSLAECSRTPAEVEREETLRRQLEVKTRQVENLEHGMGILRAKLETDSKLYRQNLASAAREKDALKRQLVAANRVVEERDKEVRALNVELRRMRRGAPPTRGGLPYHPPAFAAGGGAAGDDDAGAGSAAAAASATSAAALSAAKAAPPAAEPEERIRIMLLIVRDEIKVEVPVPVPVPMVIETPATPLMGSPRGGSEAGERPADLPEPPMEAQPDAEPQPAPEPAPEPLVPEPEPEPTPEEPEPEPPQEPALELEPLTAEPPAPEPLAEEASVVAPSTAMDGEYEPSVVGLMEDGTLAAEVSVGYMGTEGMMALEDEEADGGGAAMYAPEPAEMQAQLDAGGGGPMHMHASPPLPVPYARTQARALAAKVGGINSKISAHPSVPPPGSDAAPAAAAAAAGSTSRKPSGGGTGPAAAGAGAGNVRGGPSLKAVGAAARK